MTGEKSQAIPRCERGAAMLAALCLAMVFAICLSSYIALCYTSLMMSTRNVMNSLSSELAETGMAQALYAANNNDWSGWDISGGTATANMTMTSSGLAFTANSPTPLNYGNGVTGQVTINVANYSPSTGITSITSQGLASMPNGSLSAGSATTNISRTLTYTTTSSPSAPFFVNAVAAVSPTLGNVLFKAGGTVDSFSSNPSTGVFQNYSNVAPGANNMASAIVLSQNTNSLSATVRLGNAVVNGYAVGYSSFYPGTTNWISYGGAAKVIGPSTPAGTSIDSSRLVTDALPYQPVFDEIRPSSNATIPAADCNPSPPGNAILSQSCSLGATSAPWSPVIYNVNGIRLNGTVITITGPVVLIVWNSTVLTNGGQFLLTTPQASLTIFQEYGGMSIDNTGSGITYSGVGWTPAKRVALLSTYNYSFAVSLAQTTPFYGIIYFPYMPVTISNTGPIYGSIVGSQVTFNSAVTIHYDEALRKPDTLNLDAAFRYLKAPIAVSALAESAQ